MEELSIYEKDWDELTEEEKEIVWEALVGSKKN